ncbi:LysO family transporter [Petrocella sp. FN5]|uniref:LysO family transporter n=1 Tax=Petrocella sp. FN5 TaxID=3032002 RepID=UPI0023DA325B|nr:LysO family transporter [Petrocella sp. FN5]MDF1617228.1 hypothetical protein [Petrocella sp. FN5]
MNQKRKRSIMLLRLLLYISVLGIGMLIGIYNMAHPKLDQALGKLQILTLIGLLFVMGIRLGADKMVVASLSTIGFQAFMLAFGSIAFSVLFVFLGRQILRLDRKGRMK